MNAAAPRLVALAMLAACASASPPAAGADRVARSTPVGTGDLAPDFTLEGHDGRRYTLSAERGRRPVVLVFYRGHW